MLSLLVCSEAHAPERGRGNAFTIRMHWPLLAPVGHLVAHHNFFVAIALLLGVVTGGCLAEVEGPCEGSATAGQADRVHFDWRFDSRQQESIEWKPDAVGVAIRKGNITEWKGTGPPGCYADWAQTGKFTAYVQAANPRDPLCAWYDSHEFTKVSGEASRLPLNLGYICQ